MQKIGRYAIEREIGRGEMGTVYLATDPVLERRVALKTVRIPDGLDEAEREEYIKRFYREAQAAGKLSHHGIVTIFDAGMDEATQSHFIAMEYIAGTTLKQFLADGPRLAPRQAAFIVAGVAEALDYAHAHGVVHRDIKPANIILTDRGAVKIADFGIAKVPSSHLTMEGTYLGTPAYTSPEQVLGRPVNGRSDLFSLGIVLYELLSGRKPFPADNMGQLFHAIAYEPHTPLPQALPGCPEELAAVTDRALGKEDADRYASGLAMARDLRAYLGEGTGAGRMPDGPLAPDPGTVFDGPATPAGNPLADLLDYLEETTRRLASKDEPPAAVSQAATAPARQGLRRRLLSALASRPGGDRLARELPGRVFWAVAGGLALAAVLGLGALFARTLLQFPPDGPSPAASPVPSWRSEMRAGRADLDAGRIEQALARFQAVRLQRSDSPALARLIDAALVRLKDSLRTDNAPPEQVRRLLDLGEEASKRGDHISAGEFIQAVRGLEPANPDAAAALAALEEHVKAAVEAPDARASTVRLVFESPAPRGYLTVNLDGAQVLRKEFSFSGSADAGRGTYGRLEEPVAVTEGRHRLQVWITVKNGENYTAYGTFDGTIKAGGATLLAVRFDAVHKTKLILTLKS